MIKIGSAVSTAGNPAVAAAQALQLAVAALGDLPVHLACVFASQHPGDGMNLILGQLAPELPNAVILGCSTQSAIGGGREVEDSPAVALWLGHLPGATFRPFHMSFENTPDGHAFIGFPLVEEPLAATIILADPYSFPTQIFLQSLNEDNTDLPVFGGQASGAGAGEIRLALGDKVLTEGAVGVQIAGDIRVNPLVSQGCKPIGSPYIVTKAQGNVIFQLGGKPPLLRLREILGKLTREDRARAAHNLQLGVVIDEHKVNPKPGDFLIRPVLQADPETGAMSVGDVLSVGQTIQFQVRDADTADADLRSMMEGHIEDHGPESTGGALLFTCNGRGTNMFGTPNHDISVLQEAIPGLPVAGMFCGGEIGPIGGVNFLHGFTASIALFRQGLGLD